MREIINLLVWSSAILILLYNVVLNVIILTKYILEVYRIGKVDSIEKNTFEPDGSSSAINSYKLQFRLIDTGDIIIDHYHFLKPPVAGDTIKLIKVPFVGKLKIVNNYDVLFRLLFLGLLIWFFHLVVTSVYIMVFNSFVTYIR